jgi:hypothetical protein
MPGWPPAAAALCGWVWGLMGATGIGGSSHARCVCVDSISSEGRNHSGLWQGVSAYACSCRDVLLGGAMAPCCSRLQETSAPRRVASCHFVVLCGVVARTQMHVGVVTAGVQSGWQLVTSAGGWALDGCWECPELGSGLHGPGRGLHVTLVYLCVWG